MIAWATTKMFFRKAWARLKSVPTWLWAVVGWLVAFMALREAKKKHDRASAVSKAERHRQRRLSRRTRAIAKIKRRLAVDLQNAEDLHKKKKEELRKKDESLIAKAGNTEAITDAVNSAFGGNNGSDE